LRRRAWFKQRLPDLAHLQPVQRLTPALLQYSSLQLCDTDRLEYDQRRLAVKHAVLKRAQTFYQTDDRDDYCLYPRKTCSFKYLGQAYLNSPYTTNLAQTAAELRHNPLSGTVCKTNVTKAWERTYKFTWLQTL